MSLRSKINFLKIVLLTFTDMLLLQLFIGILVGIYGYLMPGYINLSVLQLGIHAQRKTLIQTLAIISLVEFPYCYFSMSAMHWIMQQSLFLLILRWLIVVILFLVAFLTLKDAKKLKNINEKSIENVSKKQLNKLLFFAIFNPFQLSAWAIWGTYFIEKDWFQWNFFSIAIFSLGASLGVLLILYVYAIIGKTLVSYLSNNKQKIDYGIGILLLILAFIQLIRNVL